MDADKHKWKKEELIAYDNALIAEQDERGKIVAAIKRGKEEGREEGKEEERIAMVIEMYHDGLSIERIAKITKMTVNQVTQMIDRQSNK